MRFKFLSAYIFLGLVSVSSLRPLSCQTLFEISDAAPRYEKYTYIDECDAAVRRLMIESENRGNIWLDTARFDPARLLQPVPDNIAKAAQSCIKKVNMDTLQPDLVLPAASLLLISGREEDVKRLFNRVYTSANLTQRMIWLVEFISFYSRQVPVRLEAMKDLYKIAESQEWKDTTEIHLIELGATLSLSAYFLGDTSFAKNLGEEIIARYASLAQRGQKDKSVRMTLAKYHLTKIHVDLYRMVYRSDLLDSLSIDSEAHANYLINRLKIFGIEDTHLFEKVREDSNRDVLALPSDLRFQALGNILSSGMQEYHNVPKEKWFDIPVKGKVSLIAALPGGCHRSRPNRGYLNHGVEKIRGGTIYNGALCASMLAALRRLKQKFPVVDLIIYYKTFGNVGFGAPLTPQQEADTIAKYFLGFHRLDGNLLVKFTEWIRLPGNPLDGRRIDLPEHLDIIAPAGGVGSFMAVDQEGKTFKKVHLLTWKHRSYELEFEQEIQAVLNRDIRRQSLATDSGEPSPR